MEAAATIVAALASLRLWLDLGLLLLVVTTGSLARTAQCAADRARRLAAGREPGVLDDERVLAARMLWFASIPPAFLLLEHLAGQLVAPAPGPMLLAYLVAAGALLVLMNALPQRLARRDPLGLRAGLQPLIGALVLPLRPLARHLAARRAGAPPAEAAAADEELLLHRLFDEVADEENGGEPGISERERRLLGRVVRLREQTVRQVMCPRERLLWLPQSAALDDAVACMQERGASRILITGRDLDDVLGVLHEKDLFVARNLITPAPGLVRLARQALFVRDDLPLDTLIARWRQLGGSVAVVRDASDRVAGLIALAEVLEWLLADLEPAAGGERGRGRARGEQPAAGGDGAEVAP